MQCFPTRKTLRIRSSELICSLRKLLLNRSWKCWKTRRTCRAGWENTINPNLYPLWPLMAQKYSQLCIKARIRWITERLYIVDCSNMMILSSSTWLTTQRWGWRGKWAKIRLNTHVLSIIWVGLCLELAFSMINKSVSALNSSILCRCNSQDNSWKNKIKCRQSLLLWWNTLRN